MTSPHGTSRPPSTIAILDDVRGAGAGAAGAADGHAAHPATFRARHGAHAAPRTRAATERDLVGFVCDLLSAPSGAVGEIGGGALDAATRVIRAARDARPDVRRPAVLLPSSAHPAFRIAALTLDVTPRIVPVGTDGRAEVGAVVAAMSASTRPDDVVLLVLSAPSYGFGVVDPIAWLAAAADAHGVPVHVDATNGGWHLAYARRSGRPDTPWGFDVPGVDSISLDVGPDHGLPADLTVTLRRRPVERPQARHPTTAIATEPGSRSWVPESGRLADATTTLRDLGHAGCLDLAARALGATTGLAQGLAALPGLDLVARPDATTIVVRTDLAADCFTLADELLELGWATEALPSDGGSGPLLRLQVTAAMLPLVDACVAAFDAALATAQARGPARLDPMLLGMLDRLEPDADVHRTATRMLEIAAALDAALPTTAGGVTANLLIDAAEPWVRDAFAQARHDLGVRPQQPAIRRTDARS